MAKYTFDDFMKAVEQNNLSQNFSDADIRLAQKNPDAGMSILNYKLDVRNAKTPEEKALANAGAEQIRSSYGGYTGGKRGDGFYLNPLSPGSFDPGSAPGYENRYDDQLQDMLDGLLKREDFQYDPEKDLLYSQYKKQFNREGDRAAAEALGSAAAASGGIPSSFAVTAAAQAGNYHASQLTDKIPELYQLAYNKYLADYNMDLTDLDAVRSAEQADYTKYLNELNQWNTDRAFNYGQLMDEINMHKAQRQEAMDKANIAAGYGDFSFLENMGIDTGRNPMDWERQYNTALLAAEYGDFSGLEKLGIRPNANTLGTFRRTASGSGMAGSGGRRGRSGGGNPEKTAGYEKQGRSDELTEADARMIKDTYGKELSESEWNALLSANPGITQEALTAAGFSKRVSMENMDTDQFRNNHSDDTVRVETKGGSYTYMTWSAAQKAVEKGTMKVVDHGDGTYTLEMA